MENHTHLDITCERQVAEFIIRFGCTKDALVQSVQRVGNKVTCIEHFLEMNRTRFEETPFRLAEYR